MARGKWWTDSAEEASQHLYVGDVADGTVGGHVTPGQLNTEGFLEINGQGYNWDSLRLDDIPDLKVKSILQDIPRINTDTIAEAADQAGFPGVIFRNVMDESGQPHTQYYVADPRRRRSRFAKFENPDSEDLMASLTLALMGGAGATAALNQDTDQDA